MSFFNLKELYHVQVKNSCLNRSARYRIQVRDSFYINALSSLLLETYSVDNMLHQIIEKNM